jgi:hydrogenase maturation protease
MRSGGILVAGVGNVFLGDDAFGYEVVRELRRRPQHEDVKVIDFGIRSYDLAFALTENYEALILVDAARLGVAPGLVSLIKPELNGPSEETASSPDGHSLDPFHTLQMARSWGTLPKDMYLVACEPAVVDSVDGEIGLSQTVQAAVPRAVEMVESLVDELLRDGTSSEKGEKASSRLRESSVKSLN